MREVPALVRSFRILEYIRRRPAGATAGDIALGLGLPRSATYELVHTLVVHGYLRRESDGKHRLGSQLFVLGSAYALSLDLIREASTVAQQVMARCNETVQVAVLEGREVLYIAKADSPRPVRLVSEVGRRLPAHCTALGKVLLASMGDVERRKLLSGATLDVMTPKSVSDIRQLSTELDAVAVRGYATEHGEANADGGCVAAAVHDATGACIAAMSIAVPLNRLDAQREHELVEIVLTGAEELSHRLGYREKGEDAEARTLVGGIGNVGTHTT